MIHKWSERTVGSRTEAVVCGPIEEVKDLLQQLRGHFKDVYVTQTNHDTGMLSAKIVMYADEAEEEYNAAIA